MATPLNPLLQRPVDLIGDERALEDVGKVAETLGALGKTSSGAQPSDIVAMAKFIRLVGGREATVRLPFLITDKREVKRAQTPIDEILTTPFKILSLVTKAFENPWDTERNPLGGTEVFVQGVSPSVEQAVHLQIGPEYPAHPGGIIPVVGQKLNARVVSPFLGIDYSLEALTGTLSPIMFSVRGVTPEEQMQLYISAGSVPSLTSPVYDFQAEDINVAPQELIRLMHMLILPFQTVGNYDGSQKYVYSGLMLADGQSASGQSGYASAPTDIFVDFPAGTLFTGQNADVYAPGVTDDRFWDHFEAVCSHMMPA